MEPNIVGSASASSGNSRFTLSSLRPQRPATSLVDDARAGLLTRAKSLPPKYFYDANGSRLYEAICRTPEYYPARVEAALLARFAPAIVNDTRPRTLIELGSGASRKTAHLLRACERAAQRVRYLPIDICGAMLVQAGQALAARHPWLAIDAHVGDYTLGLAHLPPTTGPRLFVFLGGTIGNFDEPEAIHFLREIRAAMEPADWLLLGADRVKDKEVLWAAYNDSAGLTARFNLNLLRVLNRELGARFDPDAFSHEARFNPDAARIEMHLRARCRQSVAIPCLGVDVDFSPGETILTEISRKFTSASLAALLRDGGFSLRHQYQPANRYFSLALAAPVF